MQTRCERQPGASLSARIRAGRIVNIAMALVCLLPAGWEQAAQAAEKAKVALGSDTAMAGGAALIPISLQIPEGVKVGSLTMEILIPEGLLQLKGARTSLGTEIAGGTVKAELSSPPDEKGSSLIRVTVTAKNELRSGAIATLDLRVADQVGSASDVLLQGRKIALTAPDGQPLKDFDQTAGKITISKTPPVFVNCFFFTH